MVGGVQIWKQPKLWEGFLKCAAQTGHHSFPVLLQVCPPSRLLVESRLTSALLFMRSSRQRSWSKRWQSSRR